MANKRYKLLKDLPTFKVGEIFYINGFGHLCSVDSGQIAYVGSTLEKFPNILKDWFEEIPKENKRWRGEYGDEYYYVDNGGVIECYSENNSFDDDYCYDTGNYFKTRKEAENYKKYLIAKQKLIDSAKGHRFLNYKLNYCVYYLGFTKGYKAVPYIDNHSPGTICFKTREDAEESLEKYKNEWDIVRKYEMGEK